MAAREPKVPYYEQVANTLIEQLESGTAPWQKPWEPGTSQEQVEAPTPEPPTRRRKRPRDQDRER